MMIVRQNVRNAQRPHGQHRPTVGETIFLVGARLVEGQRGIEVRARLGKHGHMAVVADIVDGGSGVSATGRSRAGKGVEKLGENFVGGDEPLLRLLWGSVEIVVVLRGQIIGQRIQSSRRQRRGAVRDTLSQRWARRLHKDSPRFDFGHEVGTGAQRSPPDTVRPEASPRRWRLP